MANELEGLRVAFLVANEGIEQVELVRPWEAVQQAGGRPELIAPKPGTAQAMNISTRRTRSPSVAPRRRCQ